VTVVAPVLILVRVRTSTSTVLRGARDPSRSVVLNLFNHAIHTTKAANRAPRPPQTEPKCRSETSGAWATPSVRLKPLNPHRAQHQHQYRHPVVNPSRSAVLQCYCGLRPVRRCRRQPHPVSACLALTSQPTHRSCQLRVDSIALILTMSCCAGGSARNLRS
jgi:hypothetical protein